MSKCISISPVRTRQVNKVLMNKRSRGNIHGSFRGDHKTLDVKSKKEELKQMAIAAQNEYIMLQEKMHKQFFGAAEETGSYKGPQFDVVI